MVNHATILGPAISSKEIRQKQQQREQEIAEYKAMNDIEGKMKFSLSNPIGKKKKKKYHSPNTNIHSSVTLFQRYTSEFCGHPFTTKDVTGQLYDIDETFIPKPFWLSCGIKFVFWGWSLSVLIMDVVQNGLVGIFYFDSFAHWSLIVTCLYFTFSWIVTLVPTTNHNEVTFLVFFTWGLYTIATTVELVVPILYLISGYDWTDGSSSNVDGQQVSSNVTYLNVMVYGGMELLLLLDGLVLDRIPIIVSQQWFSVLFLVVFFIWTIIEQFAWRNMNLTSDDTLYQLVNWMEQPGYATGLATLFSFVAVPIVFHLIWLLSLLSYPCSFQGFSRRFVSTNLGGSSSFASSTMSSSYLAPSNPDIRQELI